MGDHASEKKHSNDFGPTRARRPELHPRHALGLGCDCFWTGIFPAVKCSVASRRQSVLRGTARAAPRTLAAAPGISSCTCNREGYTVLYTCSRARLSTFGCEYGYYPPGVGARQPLPCAL